MATIATLVAKLVGDIGPFQASMKQAEQESKGIGERIAGGMNGALSSIGNVAKIAAGATVAGVAAIGTAAFAAGMDIDKAYDAIITKTGATGPALDGLKKDFDAVFTSIPTSAELAGNTISELNRRLGLTGAPLQNLSKDVLEMSRLLGGDAVTNAQLYSRVIGDWSIPTADASKSLNQLFVISQKTGVGTEKLMEQVVQFGSPMRLMGFSFQDTAALLAKWEKEGVNAELVMGSLRVAAGKFAKEGKPLRESLLSTFDSIKKNKDATAALAQGMAVFGAKAGPDMVAAIREGRFATEDLVAAMSNADNAIANTADATADFPEKFEVMKNKVEKALAPIGLMIMDGISKAMDALGPILDKGLGLIQDFIDGATAAGDFDPFQGLANVFYSLAGTDTGSVFQSIGDALVNLQSVAQPIIDAFIGGLQSIWNWVQTNGPTIIDGVITGVQNAYNSIQPILQSIYTVVSGVFNAVRGFVAEHGADIQATFQQAWSTIGEIVNGIRQIVEQVWGAIAQWVSDNQETIKGIFTVAWNTIKIVVGSVLDIIRGIVNAVLALLKGDTQGALDAIKNIFVNIWDRIKDTVSQAVESVRMLLLIVWAKIKEAVENAWAGIRKGIEDAWDGIVNFFKSLPETLFNIGKSIMEGLWNGIKSMFENIGNGISNWFTSTIDDIKKKLGIQSPSTIFHGIGMNMMSGLALGIRSSADLPQAALEAAMSGVTSPSILLARERSGSQAAANNTENWNVQTDAAGLALLLEQKRRKQALQFEARM